MMVDCIAFSWNDTEGLSTVQMVLFINIFTADSTHTVHYTIFTLDVHGTTNKRHFFSDIMQIARVGKRLNVNIDFQLKPEHY